MPATWTEVEANPEFQSLPTERKASIQRDYFDKYILPEFSDEGGALKLRGEFFTKYDYGNQPSLMGAIGRGGARGALPLAGATLVGGLAAAPFTGGSSLLVPAISSIIGGFGGYMGTEKLQDIAAEKFAPDSIFGKESIRRDMESQPYGEMLGRFLVGGRPSISGLSKAGETILTKSGRDAARRGMSEIALKGSVNAARETMPEEIAALEHTLHLVGNAGAGAALGAVEGQGLEDIALSTAGMTLFNKGWINHPNPHVNARKAAEAMDIPYQDNRPSIVKARDEGQRRQQEELDSQGDPRMRARRTGEGEVPAPLDQSQIDRQKANAEASQASENLRRQNEDFVLKAQESAKTVQIQTNDVSPETAIAAQEALVKTTQEAKQESNEQLNEVQLRHREQQKDADQKAAQEAAKEKEEELKREQEARDEESKKQDEIDKQNESKTKETKPKTEAKPEEVVQSKVPVVSAAIWKDPSTGEVYRGKTHEEAINSANKAGVNVEYPTTKKGRETDDFGFEVSNPDGTTTQHMGKKGRRLAGLAGLASGQLEGELPRKGIVHSSDFKEPLPYEGPDKEENPFTKEARELANKDKTSRYRRDNNKTDNYEYKLPEGMTHAELWAASADQEFSERVLPELIKLNPELGDILIESPRRTGGTNAQDIVSGIASKYNPKAIKLFIHEAGGSFEGDRGLMNKSRKLRGLEPMSENEVILKPEIPLSSESSGVGIESSKEEFLPEEGYVFPVTKIGTDVSKIDNIRDVAKKHNIIIDNIIGDNENRIYFYEKGTDKPIKISDLPEEVKNALLDNLVERKLDKSSEPYKSVIESLADRSNATDEDKKRAKSLTDRMLKRMGNRNLLLDPEAMKDAVEYAKLSIKFGVKLSKDFVSNAIKEFGEWIRPYLTYAWNTASRKGTDTEAIRENMADHVGELARKPNVSMRKLVDIIDGMGGGDKQTLRDLADALGARTNKNDSTIELAGKIARSELAKVSEENKVKKEDAKERESLLPKKKLAGGDEGIEAEAIEDKPKSEEEGYAKEGKEYTDEETAATDKDIEEFDGGQSTEGDLADIAAINEFLKSPGESNEQESTQFNRGDDVSFDKDGQSFDGVIESINDDGTVTVDYEKSVLDKEEGEPVTKTFRTTLPKDQVTGGAASGSARIPSRILDFADSIHNMTKDFGRWSKAMITKFGNGIKDSLKNLWTYLKNSSERGSIGSKSTEIVGDGGLEVGTTGADVKRLIELLRNRQDKGDTTFVAGRELLQNSADAVMENSQKEKLIAFGDNYSDNSAVVMDSGGGMSPSFLMTTYLSMGSSGKKIGDAGGLGIAKGQFLGNAQNFDIRSIWTDPKTKERYITRLTGNGDGFIKTQSEPAKIKLKEGEEHEINDGLKVFYRKLSTSDSSNSPFDGTFVKVIYDKKLGDTYSLKNAIRKGAEFLPEINFQELGKDYGYKPNENLLTKDSGYAAELGKEGKDIFHGESEKKPVYSLQHSIDLPEADVEIFYKEGSEIKDGKYIPYTILSRGLYQFTDAMQTKEPVSLPKDIAVNIKSKVKASDKNYAFSLDRKSTTDSVTKAILGYFGGIGKDAYDKRISQFDNAEKNAPKIGNTDSVLLDVAQKIPSDKMMEISNDEHIQGVASVLKDIQTNIGKILSKRYGGSVYEDYKFGGLLSGTDNAYGVRFGKKGDKGTIYLDPFLTMDLAQKQAKELGMTGVPDIMDQWLGNIIGTALHENLHQTIHSEGEELARGLTFTAGRLAVDVDTLKAAIETITKNTNNLENYYEALNKYSSEISQYRDSESSSNFVSGKGGSFRYSQVGEELTGKKVGSYSKPEQGKPEESSNLRAPEPTENNPFVYRLHYMFTETPTGELQFDKRKINPDGTIDRTVWDSRTSNVPKYEKAQYESLVPEAFTEGKVNVKMLDEKLRDLPSVEVHTYGQRGKGSEAKKELDKMTHEWYDNLDRRERVDANVVVDKVLSFSEGLTPRLQHVDEKSHATLMDLRKALDSDLSNNWTDKDLVKLYKFAQLKYVVSNEPQDTSPRATQYYNIISPLDTKKHPVKRIDVVLPLEIRDNPDYLPPNVGSGMTFEMERLTNLRKKTEEHPIWPQDNLHENLPNTLGWAMVQELPDPKTGEKTWFIAELQSRWAQEKSKEEVRVKEAIASMNPLRKVDVGIDFPIEKWEFKDPWGGMDSVTAKSKEEAAEKIKQRLKKTTLGQVPDHPLLSQWMPLTLKAVKDQATRSGVKRVVLSDKASAAMTQGHDKLIKDIGDNVDKSNLSIQAKSDKQTLDLEDQAARGMITLAEMNQFKNKTQKERIDRYLSDLNKRYSELGGGVEFKSQDGKIIITKEPFMAGHEQNYDKRGPDILKKITGNEGEQVDLGVHKNAIKRDGTGEGHEFQVFSHDRLIAAFTTEEAAKDYINQHRQDQRNNMEIRSPEMGSPVFKNPDGTPKTNITGKEFDLSNSNKRALLYGDPLMLRTLVDVVQTMGRQAKDLAGFTKGLVQRFGDWIGEHAKALWEAVKSGADAVKNYIKDVASRNEGSLLGGGKGNEAERKAEGAKIKAEVEAKAKTGIAGKIADEVKETGKLISKIPDRIDRQPAMTLGDSIQNTQGKMADFKRESDTKFRNLKENKAAYLYTDSLLRAKENKVTPEVQLQRDLTDIKKADPAKGREWDDAYRRAIMGLTPEQKAFAKDNAREVLLEYGKRLEGSGHLKMMEDEQGKIKGSILDNDSLGFMPRYIKEKDINKRGSTTGRKYESLKDMILGGHDLESWNYGDAVMRYANRAEQMIARPKMLGDAIMQKGSDGKNLGIIVSTHKADPKDQSMAPVATVDMQRVSDDAETWTDDKRHYTKVIDPRSGTVKIPIRVDIGGGLQENRIAEVALNPMLSKIYKAETGHSIIKDWYQSPSTSAPTHVVKKIVQGLDKLNTIAKSTMFLGNLFHVTTTGVRLLSHGAIPFGKIDSEQLNPANNARLRDHLAHGANLYSERSEMSYGEGAGIVGLGRDNPVSKLLSMTGDWMFSKAIPWMQVKAYDAQEQRVMKKFGYTPSKDQIPNQPTKFEYTGKGEPKQSVDSVKDAIWSNINDEFGHINWRLIGADKTMRHLASMALLAPNFQIGSLKTLARGLEGIPSYAGDLIGKITGKEHDWGNRVSQEQTRALLLTTVAGYALARALNWILNNGDTKKDHPFQLVIDGKAYGLRTLPGDFAKMWGDPAGWAQSRLSPVAKLADEEITGRNQRGEKISHLQGLQDLGAGFVPMTLRGVPGLNELVDTTRTRPVSLADSALQFIGVHASDASPIRETYARAAKWKEANGEANEGSYPISHLTPLKRALEDGDIDAAHSEWNKLVTSAHEKEPTKSLGEIKGRIISSLKASIEHPFTGKKSSEDKFLKSLDSDAKAEYKEAIRKFNSMWHFAKLVSGVGQGELRTQP